jgi:hypothetical protein
MASTTFSGPVRSGYQGGNADPQNPITPTTLMLVRLLKLTKAPALTVSIPELNRLLVLALVPFKLPVKLMACLDEFKLALRLQQSPHRFQPYGGSCW